MTEVFVAYWERQRCWQLELKIKSETYRAKPLESRDHDLIMEVHYGIVYGTYGNNVVIDHGRLPIY